jgi:hypothetical protein
MTPSGIKPATFRFVAQYLNHCATISGLQLYVYVQYINNSCVSRGKSQAIPIQDEAPRLQDNRHKNVVGLSTLRTGHLYPPR